MSNSGVQLPQAEIASFCRRNHVRRLSLFGSALRGELRADSDVDLLVEFEPGHVPGLAFFAMERELSAVVGRKVDLHTPGFLSPCFRDGVFAEAEAVYVAPQAPVSARSGKAWKLLTRLLTDTRKQLIHTG